jgi:hypothetical protein
MKRVDSPGRPLLKELAVLLDVGLPLGILVMVTASAMLMLRRLA